MSALTFEQNSFGLAGGLVIVIVPQDQHLGEDRHLADFLDAIAHEYRAHAERADSTLDFVEVAEQNFELSLASGIVTVKVPALEEEEAAFAADFLALVAKYYRRSAEKGPPPAKR